MYDSKFMTKLFSGKGQIKMPKYCRTDITGKHDIRDRYDKMDVLLILPNTPRTNADVTYGKGKRYKFKVRRLKILYR